VVLSNSVFISYRRDVGGLWALALYQQLHEAGIDAFYDIESLRQSGRFNAMLLTQIATRPYFLLVLTPGTLDRCRNKGDWLRQEIDQALETDRVVVPLHTANFDYADFERVFPPDAAAQLSSFSGVELSQTYFTAAVQRLTSEFLVPIEVEDVAVSAEEAADHRAAAEIAEQEPTVSPEILRAQELFLSAYGRPDSDPEGKITDLSEAISLYPGFARAYLFRGYAVEAQGDATGARADYEAAARLDPHDADAERELARLNAALAEPPPAPPPLPPPSPAPIPRPPDDDRSLRRVATYLIGAAAAVAVLVLVLLVWARLGGDDSNDPTGLPATTAPPATDAPGTDTTQGPSTTAAPPDRLESGDQLAAGDVLRSANGRHSLEMTADGELVATTGSDEWWRQPEDAPPGAVAIMQGDGNLVVYPSASQTGQGHDIWDTGTSNNPGAELVVDEEDGFGRVAVVATDGTVLWDETARPEPETVPVPDVRQLTEHGARLRLEEAGFEVTTTQRPSDELGAGLVIDTEPPPGTEVRPGSAVELIVAAPVPVTVPELLGLPVEQAEATLAAMGLVPEARLEQTSGVPAGIVTSQDPFAGTEVAEGSIVVILVSEGPFIG
jgi:hypothetical protein